jgi:toxin ParE1/3/4
MAFVRTRPQAEADLEEIWWYIAQDNPDAADAFLDQIEERCAVLAQFPLMGTDREDLLPFLRSLVVGSYAVFYLPVIDGIEIARVLHGRRDLDALF